MAGISVDTLYTAHQARIAPGDDAEFLRLLTEADMRLGEFGRWRWTRGRKSLTPVSQVVTLPIDAVSILGARVDAFPTDVMAEDLEFAPGGPGELTVGGAHDIRVLDQGLNSDGERYYKVLGVGDDDFTLYTICHLAPFALYKTADLPTSAGVSIAGTTPAVAESLVYAGEDDDGSLFTSDGLMGLTGANRTVLVHDGFNWYLSHYDSNGDADYAATKSSTNTTPVGLTGWIVSIGSGSPTVTSLAVGDSLIFSSVTRCPSSAALKLAMLAILFEEQHDSGSARAYMSDALKVLDNHEKTACGNARQVPGVRTGSGLSPIANFI